MFYLMYHVTLKKFNSMTLRNTRRKQTSTASGHPHLYSMLFLLKLNIVKDKLNNIKII